MILTTQRRLVWKVLRAAKSNLQFASEGLMLHLKAMMVRNAKPRTKKETTTVLIPLKMVVLVVSWMKRESTYLEEDLKNMECKGLLDD